MPHLNNQRNLREHRYSSPPRMKEAARPGRAAGAFLGTRLSDQQDSSGDDWASRLEKSQALVDRSVAEPPSRAITASSIWRRL